MQRTLYAAAILVAALAAGSASAAEFAAPASGNVGAAIPVDDNRYYDNGYYDNGANDWQFQYQDRDYGTDWRANDYYHDGYCQRGVISPRWIVRNLRQADYRYISRPVLAGRFYQVKAVNPNGKKVKLYIDAYSGRIVKVKG